MLWKSEWRRMALAYANEVSWRRDQRSAEYERSNTRMKAPKKGWVRERETEWERERQRQRERLHLAPRLIGRSETAGEHRRFQEQWKLFTIKCALSGSGLASLDSLSLSLVRLKAEGTEKADSKWGKVCRKFFFTFLGKKTFPEPKIAKYYCDFLIVSSLFSSGPHSYFT